jgi:hypothetical protein
MESTPETAGKTEGKKGVQGKETAGFVPLQSRHKKFQMYLARVLARRIVIQMSQV